MPVERPNQGGDQRSRLERALAIFTDVRAGEGGTALLLTLGLFMLLSSYYIIKPIRDSLITGVPKGPEYKSYMSAAIAVALLFAVPAYSRFASRLPRHKLILSVTAFFVSNLVGFYLLSLVPAMNAGVLQLLYVLGFFLWVGIFNMMVVAQYWAFANDVYTEEQGKRLFPLIGIGASVGSAVGSMILAAAIKQLQKSSSNSATIALLLIAAVILGLSAVIMFVVHRRDLHAGVKNQKGAKAEAPRPEAKEVSRDGAFKLVFSHRYLMLLALFSLVFTLVNTNSEYVKDVLIKARAQDIGAARSASQDQIKDIRTELFNEFYLWVNLLGALLQSFVVSRIVKFLGLRRAFFILPCVALLDATTIALLPVWGIVKFAKISENALDYSLNNTLRNMLWLPTTRRMKYIAKQAVDTFFVRAGDVGSALCVFVLADVLQAKVRVFAAAHVVLLVGWFVLARLIGRENQRMTEKSEKAQEGQSP